MTCNNNNNTTIGPSDNIISIIFMVRGGTRGTTFSVTWGMVVSCYKKPRFFYFEREVVPPSNCLTELDNRSGVTTFLVMMIISTITPWCWT